MLEQQTKHKTVTRDEWLKARITLLNEEKELTHQSDALAEKRRDLPWVEVSKPYKFDTEKGPASLKDLFRGNSQLIIYHFMFGPDYKAGCPSCSSIADSFNGVYTHLANHDVTFWAVSRAPLAKLKEYQQRMGWTFPWASSAGSDFNADYSVAFTEEQQRKGDTSYNFGTVGNMASDPNGDPNAAVPDILTQIAATTGTDWPTYSREAPGMSSFAIQDGKVHHTYSAYARGLDVLWSMYQWLDRAPLGRNETSYWLHRHDEYPPSHKATGDKSRG
jgi:predicted dithiol-disulfide oxidoreductase (DUF899 family)